MKTHKVRPVLVESKDIHSQLEIDDISIGKLSYEANQYYCKHPQELILISLEDEKIEVEDIVYHERLNIITHYFTNAKAYLEAGEYKKVIARQSQIPPEYISKFIEQYNNGCVEDLEIMMENRVIKHIPWSKELESKYDYEKGYPVTGYVPKLTNGFVTIVEKEVVLYTKNDMRDAFEAGHKLGWSGYPNTDNWTQPKFEEWFNENKKK